MTNTRIWAGGTDTLTATAAGDFTFPFNEVFEPINNTDVFGSDLVIQGIIGTGGGASSTAGSSLRLENSAISWDGTAVDTGGGNISNGMSMIFTNVSFSKAGTNYHAFGNWNTRNLAEVPIYVFNGVNFHGDVAANGETGMSFFNGNAAATKTIDGVAYTSAFNNVSFWNGETLASGNAKGGVGQLNTGTPIVSAILGPVGTNLNSSGHLCLLRFANQNSATAALVNHDAHQGITCGLDFRAVSQLDTTQRAYITADGGASIAHINPIIGLQGGSGGTFFTRQFSGGSRQEVYVATNPQTTDGGLHLVTFQASDLVTTDNTSNPEQSRGIKFLPETWDPTNPPGFVSGQVHTLPTNGFMLRQLAYEGTTSSNTIASNVRTAVVSLEDWSYRKYSWNQQPTAGLFGRSVVITTPTSVAGTQLADSQVTTARNNGFNQYTGTGWDDTTDVDDLIDPVTSLPAFDTPAKTLAHAANTGEAIVAKSKLISWNDVSNGVDANNARVLLGYSMSGTTATYGLALNLNAAAGTNAANGSNSTSIFNVTDTRTSEAVTVLKATTINLVGDILSSDNDKVTFDGTTINLPDTTYTRASFRADTVSGFFASENHSGVNFAKTATVNLSTTGLTADGALQFSDIFGTNPTVSSGTVTVNSPVQIFIDGLAPGFAAGTNVTVSVNYTIESDQDLTVGLLRVYRNGTPDPVSAANPVVTSIQPNQVVDIVYIEPGRTDFLHRIIGGPSPISQTVTVMNIENFYNNSSTDTSAIFGTSIPVNGVMNIGCNQDEFSGVLINDALQEELKRNAHYADLIQQTQITDICSSDGETAALNGDHINITSGTPYTIGYVRNSGTSTLTPKTTRTLVGGDTIEVGVTILLPAGFDPNITAVQIGTAVQQINANTDEVTTDVSAALTATQTALTTSIGENKTAIEGVNTVATGLQTNVNKTVKGMGYLISNGDSTTPAVTGGRLGGIKPKNADYSSTATYEEIL